MSEFTIKQIFIDNWDNFIVRNPELNIRQVVFDEVEKIMNCGNPDYGYALYVCEHCKKFVKVPFRCKSRFCNTCGVKYAQDRAFSMTKKSIRCKHRHIVFTMSDKLWPYFLKYRNLLDGLFSSASSAILSWFYELNKSQNFTPGIMCTLHTFGRDLKWNPHIHMLCTEGGAGNTEVFRIVKHINFKALRFRWQKLLLDYLQNNLPANELPKFKQLKNQIYKEYNNGFYVYAKPDNISSINQTINYVVRYTGRPAMAQSRIIDYDGTYVTYYYERHEDGKRIEEKITKEYTSQRTKDAADGNDWKALSHAIRVLLEVKQLLEDGTITFPCIENRFLLRIKQGKINREVINEFFNKQLSNILEKVKLNELGWKYDEEFWNEFILNEVKNGI